jgi:ABC-2 type transport system permease protein
MTPAQATRVPRGRYRFRHAAAMEWIKLRTLRSTWWTLGISVAGAVAIGGAAGRAATNASGDLTNNALAGLVPGLLLAGVLGVLVMTSEYSSGMIRATLAAVPGRPLLLAAKAAVFGAVTLAAGEIAAFAAFFAGGATLPPGVPAPALGQPAVLRAVLLSGTSFCLIGLLGLGLGAIIRHSPAAIGVLAGGVYVVAQVIGAVAHDVRAYMPVLIVGNSISTTRPLSCGGPAGQCQQPLPAWTGLGLLCLYAAVALAAGGWLLSRRDA